MASRQSMSRAGGNRAVLQVLDHDSQTLCSVLWAELTTQNSVPKAQVSRDTDLERLGQWGRDLTHQIDAHREEAMELVQPESLAP